MQRNWHFTFASVDCDHTSVTKPIHTSQIKFIIVSNFRGEWIKIFTAWNEEKKIKLNYVYRDFNRPLCIVINSYNALDPNSFAINNNVFISFHFNFSMWFRNSEIKMNRVSLLFESVQTVINRANPEKHSRNLVFLCVFLFVFALFSPHTHHYFYVFIW